MDSFKVWFFFLFFVSSALSTRQTEVNQNNTNISSEGADSNQTNSAQKLTIDLSSWETYETLVNQGGMKGYFTADQVDEMMESINYQFPEIVLPVEILGQTYEKRDIKLHCFTRKTGNTTLQEESKNKTIAMITALHHSREPMSLSMLMFFLQRILVEYKKNSQEYINLIDNNILCALPIVNVDGYAKIFETFNNTGKFVPIRKNRNNSGSTKCSSNDVGVDLNRNYDYGWDINNEGSSPKPCEEDYRGSTPFSESETQAIRDFVDKYQSKLKIVVNLHAYGNLWILPFNCYKDDSKYLSPRIKSIYKDFRNSGKFPQNALVGNAIETVHYTANGEASDWLLGKYGIIAMSPEIGLHHAPDDKFFPSKEFIYPVVTGDFDAVFYMVSKLNPKFRINDTTDSNLMEFDYKQIVLEVFNECYRELQGLKLELSLTLSGLNEGFLSNPSLPDISFVQIHLDHPKPDSASISVSSSQSDNKETKVMTYTASQEFDFGSWNYIQLAAKLPNFNFEGVQFKLRILSDKNEELFTQVKEYNKEKTTVFPAPNKKVSILVISITLAFVATLLIILITKCYLNSRKSTKSHNMYGVSKPKGLEFAQIGGDTESLDSSKL